MTPGPQPGVDLAYPDPSLTDATVILRPWQRADVACVREGKAVGPDDALAWIEGQSRRLREGAGLSLAIADAGSGTAQGHIGLLIRPRPGPAPPGGRDPATGAARLLFEPQPGTAGIGYWVLERARGRGLASRAVGLLAGWALTDAAMLRIEALVEPHNTGSRRVLERAGFRREGHLRAYLDLDPEGRRGDALVYSLLPADLGGTGG
jgi:RimJ/RimL family protein N-acetyltransferase